MYPSKNPLVRLKQCPPFFAYALVREKYGKRRTLLTDIVKRSGLAERTFLRTVKKESWDGVKLSVIEGVLRGTQVNPWAMGEHWRWLREHNFQLQYLSKKQRANFEALCARNLKR